MLRGQNGLTRPSWNVQSYKDGGSQMVRFSKKLNYTANYSYSLKVE
jgi:hypothetical protein